VDSLIPHLGWLAHPPDDEVAHHLAEGWFEYREQAFWWMYLREGDTVIDAGAHFGLYASLAGRLTGATGKVLAVEANPHIESLLGENLERYAGERGRLLAVALASRPGNGNFFICGGGRAAYSASVAETPGSEPLNVQLVTVDNLCREHAITRVALAKLDVEGDEIEALRGARESISSGVLPLWMIEFTEANQRRRGSSTRALFEEISSLGYTVCRFDELRCRLAPIEWKDPVWYENYFAATSPDEVNQRLAGCPLERGRVARDILRHGAAAMALREAAGKAESKLAGTEKQLAALEEQLQEAGARAEEVARRMAAEKTEAAQRAEMERGEAAQSLEAAQQAARDAGRRAEEIDRHLQESWRRIGEANWRADQAVNRAETAAERSESAYRRLEVADRRAANARYESGLLKTRLRDLLLHPRLAGAPIPEWDALPACGEDYVPVPFQSDSEDPMQRALYHLSGRNFRPRTVLDAGAGKGYWSLNAHSFFPAAEFYMVDPLDENEPDLRRICQQNPQFHFLNAALGDVDGVADIHVTPDLFGSSCLPSGVGDKSGRSVPQRTADLLLREGCIAAPDLVKIDVQGYELKVLNGAESVLKTAEVVIVEVNLFRFMPGGALAHEVIGYLAARGFVLFDLAGSLRRPFQDDLAQLDLIFVPAHSDLVKSARWT
jgi:FkbM family methyltransferase